MSIAAQRQLNLGILSSPAGGNSEAIGGLDNQVEQHRLAPVNVLCLLPAPAQLLRHRPALAPHQQGRAVSLQKHFFIRHPCTQQKTG